MTWICPYCEMTYPLGAGYDMKGRRKRGDNEPLYVLCAVCKEKHRICTKCVRNTDNVFWDKPGGPMKVHRCAKAMACLDAIEGPMRSTMVCKECESEVVGLQYSGPGETITGRCLMCDKTVELVLKKVPASPPMPPGWIP